MSNENDIQNILNVYFKNKKLNEIISELFLQISNLFHNVSQNENQILESSNIDNDQDLDLIEQEQILANIFLSQDSQVNQPPKSNEILNANSFIKLSKTGLSSKQFEEIIKKILADQFYLKDSNQTSFLQAQEILLISSLNSKNFLKSISFNNSKIKKEYCEDEEDENPLIWQMERELEERQNKVITPQQNKISLIANYFLKLQVLKADQLKVKWTKDIERIQAQIISFNFDEKDENMNQDEIDKQTHSLINALNERLNLVNNHQKERFILKNVYKVCNETVTLILQNHTKKQKNKHDLKLFISKEIESLQNLYNIWLCQDNKI